MKKLFFLFAIAMMIAIPSFAQEITVTIYPGDQIIYQPAPVAANATNIVYHAEVWKPNPGTVATFTLSDDAKKAGGYFIATDGDGGIGSGYTMIVYVSTSATSAVTATGATPLKQLTDITISDFRSDVNATMGKYVTRTLWRGMLNGLIATW
jgi:hypothetical protein